MAFPHSGNPHVYLSKGAPTLNNLGVLRSDEDRLAEARGSLEESLKIYRAFAKVAPAASESYVSHVQVNLNALP